jgi:FixJ family two-component response regulator
LFPEAETLASALSYLDYHDRSTEDRPSCVLLEVHLQGVDGFELQRTLAEHEIQSVFSTVMATYRMCAHARNGGAWTTRRFSSQFPGS